MLFQFSNFSLQHVNFDFYDRPPCHESFVADEIFPQNNEISDFHFHTLGILPACLHVVAAHQQAIFPLFPKKPLFVKASVEQRSMF